MATAPKTTYLSKLINLLIKRAGGSIRIPAADLMSNDKGEGFQVHFDNVTKELVLSFVPEGSTVYRIEESTTWVSSEALHQQRQEPSPLSREELLAKAWTGSVGTETLEESRTPKPQVNRVVQLTSEGNAEAELQRRKAAALKALEEWDGQSPSPQSHQQTTRTPSRPVTMFSKP